MKQDDPVVDRVLRALGDLEPSAGMESRLLARLQAVEAEQASVHSKWWRGRVAWAAIALAVVALSVVGTRHRAVGTASRDVAVKRAVAVSVPQSNAPTVASTAVHAEARSSTRALHAVVVHEAVVEQRAVPATQEASFPAPPLPLTESERLLLQLKHRGDPVQLAQLSQPERNAAEERDRQQVREFFKPAPPPPDAYKDVPPVEVPQVSEKYANPGEAQ